jgi:hypothetical protein
MRSPVFAVAALCASLPLAAQAPARADRDPTNAVTAAPLPAGWQMRLDDKDAAKHANFVEEAGGYHVTSGGAALYYRAKDAQPNRDFTERATFIQTKPTRFHGEAYGLFLVGRDLADTAKQTYLYFEVRQNGDFLVNHRAGSAVHKVIDWTVNDAIHKPDASGVATNELSVAVGADSIRFMANGTQVAALPRAGFADASGQAGLRVNHNLDVKIEHFTITPRGR